MDISSQKSIAVYCAENWKMLLARIHLFLRTFIKKLTKGDQTRAQVGFQLFDYSSH